MYGVTCRVTKKLDRFERRAVERLLAEAGLVFEVTDVSRHRIERVRITRSPVPAEA